MKIIIAVILLALLSGCVNPFEPSCLNYPGGKAPPPGSCGLAPCAPEC